ncbi:Eco57I restriction-modification methylase domain-containing protein [Helicobacter bizzozeronii]|uniref:Eco57I restriction-modification methylase domain-containing protein n=1 Tax=Helicobacter bizzozeronii TaxID=56877 RepID=UPI00244D9221|nr:N-6 DNA methylase [Helicobacter bizzozeronii]GMB92692.1 Eco57I restriction-modification methylase domain-containing protein [Helicobacter bizzozeronii]
MFYFHNNLFTPYTLEQEFPKLYNFKDTKEQAKALLEKITALKLQNFKTSNEHQFEDGFIAKVLELLGWEYLRQEEKIIQDKLEKPDFLLFASPGLKQEYQALDKAERYASNAFFSVICESKAYSVAIDNKKITHNPHYQLLGYLNALRHNYGFLTNGRVWRFYDARKPTYNKVFFEINLELILQTQNLDHFLYFYHLFNAANFLPQEDQHPQISATLQTNEQHKQAVEKDLQNLIYGTEGYDFSLFEDIGKALYARNPQATLKEIYQNTLYFLFRLLFIAYFEDKFEDTLKEHICFKDYLSVRKLLKMLGDRDNSYVGMGQLEQLFAIYNEGNENYAMPLFDGGLFEPEKTALFKKGKIISDKLLKQILTHLLYYGESQRGYATLSVVHLGSIYEGLMSYFFALADEELHYCTTPKGEGYYDNYDYQKIQKQAKKTQHYAKGQIYLKNTSNSRKSSGSFYTHEDITKSLVEHALAGLNDDNVLNFKILDNACGSGAFLIEALNQASQKALGFEALRPLLQEEINTLSTQVQAYNPAYEVDEAAILKRLLLKKMIYGVDVNPFSIELAKLSLWIDSFIFGTPLSFLEHHIKCGNALIGCSLKEFEAFLGESGGLFNDNFFKEFETLKTLFSDLANIPDSTKEEIGRSKKLYGELKPHLDQLNLYLNFYNTHRIIAHKADPTLKEFWREKAQGLEGVGLEQLHTPEYAKVKECIEAHAKEFKFFNYEIEFPEIAQGAGGLFALQHSGFNAIVTNPPWEKTKFDESEFFSSFRSNYRTFSLQEKKEFKVEALAKDYIQEQYHQEQAHILTTNAYYKAHYPNSRGAGDGNLFRFFIERNLSLLAPQAKLALVIPSALMLEEGSLHLRAQILKEHALEFFYSFENRQGIFPSVHRCYKFALLGMCQEKSQQPIKALFYLENVSDIAKQSPLLISPTALLETPKCALKEVRNALDLEILDHCAAQFSRLSEGWLDFRQELNMTTDKDLFIPPNKVQGKTQAAMLLPLLEGKHIHQFNAEFASPRYGVEAEALQERLKSREQHRAKKGGYSGAIAYEYQYWRLGYRGIARDTDERSLIVSLIPRNYTAGHSIYLSVPYTYTPKGILETPPLQTLFILGLFNSLVVDFLLRLHSQMNISKIYLYELPLPQPTPQEIANNPLYLAIAKSALECQLYYDSANHFSELKTLFTTPLDIPKTQKLLNTKRAELDILIARDIYALSRDQFLHLLDSFRVLQNKQPGFVALLKDLWEE